LLTALLGNVRIPLQVDIPLKLPLALSDEFSTDPVKHTQWKAFLNMNEILEVSENLTDII